ncbi:hypothetical protein [Microcoleus sp. Pol11C3]|uniref:hypothetical protein n=1 Tax=Microcoleus sp. Pol11C3 TaxID=3055390 RepID=UPI002FD6909E
MSESGEAGIASQHEVEQLQTVEEQYFGQFFNGPVSLTEEALPFLRHFRKLSVALKP